MKWEEVRSKYPNQWVKLNIIGSHMENDKKIIDDMEVIKPLLSDDEAGEELGRCKNGESIYHTYHEEIAYSIKRLFGFRKAIS